MHRGYNQSLELAKGISRLTGITLDTRSVSRRHYRTSQTRLTPAERTANVDNTFVVHHNSLQGKHVLIVDDVITSNATIMACAKVLNNIPGIRISVLALAVSRNLMTNIKGNNPQENKTLAFPQMP